MDTMEAILIMTGDADCISQIAEHLPGIVQLSTVADDDTTLTSQSDDSNTLIIKLPLSTSNDCEALNDVESWLNTNHSTIEVCNCEKTIEFQILLDSETGSRILSIPLEIVQLCNAMNIRISMQAIRKVSESEIKKWRSS